MDCFPKVRAQESQQVPSGKQQQHAHLPVPIEDIVIRYMYVKQQQRYNLSFVFNNITNLSKDSA